MAEVECPECRGSGQGDTATGDCAECDGHGWFRPDAQQEEPSSGA